MSVVHGYTAYIEGCCRCLVCTQAKAEYEREARERRRGTLAPEDSRHGLYSTYNNWCCRCWKCRDAAAAYVQATRRARKAAAS